MPDTMFADVLAFHRKFGVMVGTTPAEPSNDVVLLRNSLHFEELSELTRAMAEGYLPGIADGIADLIYVLLGTAVSYGIPFDEVWREVHRSNMAKLWPDGKPRLRADGKILKSADWTPPDIKSILDSKRS